MPIESFLKDKDIDVLTKSHKNCCDKKTADRIKAVLLINKGYSYLQIEEILLLDERTLSRLKKLYLEKGLIGLVSNNYLGGFFKLSDDQIKNLKDEIDSNLYSTAKEICNYVEKTFNVKYTPQGMVQTLHKLGYSYKKTSPVPGKMNSDKQRHFVEEYEKLYKTLPNNEKVFFLDGCHPTFNNHFGKAWIKTGSDFEVKTQTGRKHLNLMGAFNPKNQETIIKNYSTLNRDAVKDFLKLLRKRNEDCKLHVIWDNVPYQHSEEVKQLAKDLEISLVYLPPYSPNLNLIERYWGFLKKKLLLNKYFSSFEEFHDAIINFSKKKSKKLKIELASYIPEKFHLYSTLES